MTTGPSFLFQSVALCPSEYGLQKWLSRPRMVCFISAILTHRKLRQKYSQVQDQPELHSDFQASLGS